MTGNPRHGSPRITRNEQWGFDKYEWPSGLALFLYDDGRVKLERLDSAVAVESVNTYSSGKERGSAHVVARFNDNGESPG
ncbi:hypothetical protein [Thermomonospora umbrina]|uniref:Uncharacterized protein n=1 Tax=Thermomonospora umbrina TaxID=111806 RepID=A0A3D9SWK5_9ACTN|nr:hypothetical protein [Thermomonospora umbrina]REF00317.1 hypothetical protein DFJ69_5848 [Thermomonospora umbrina]